MVYFLKNMNPPPPFPSSYCFPLISSLFKLIHLHYQLPKFRPFFFFEALIPQGNKPVMGTRKRLLIFVFLSILLQLVPTVSEPNPFLGHFCNYDYGGNDTTSIRTFQRNLNTLPSFLTSNTSFYNFTIGLDPDTINVIALCRGDIGPDTCRICLNNSNTKLQTQCPHHKESIIWYENCMLRYSTLAIFNTMNIVPNTDVHDNKMAQDVDQLNKVVTTLLDRLQGEAAVGDSVMKFAIGNMSGPNMNMYGMVQCTPDLTYLQCSECVGGIIENFPRCCYGKVAARVLAPSCRFRYKLGPFNSRNGVDSPDAPPADDEPSQPPPRSITGNGEIKIKIIIIVPTIIFVILICFGIYICLRKRKQRTLEDKYNGLDDISSVEYLQHDFDTIQAATRYFSDSNKLGQGGFGAVYKGTLLDGREIAVKRLSRNSGQGEQEFKNEVSLLGKLQHRSLVRLLGFSLKGTERLLIYEHVPNASLDHFIFDPEKRANLDADARYKIIIGVARGLLYLHEDSRLRIIHRDLKASNILLDSSMHPKIADFGMARLFAPEETRASTSRIVGTYGYMTPEYVILGRFSVKSDVFSFGVIVLEIISGQKNSFQNGEDIEYLISHAWKKWRDGRASDVIDPLLTHGASSIEDIKKCIHVALLCVQQNVADRPTMASVVHMLNSTSQTFQVPSEPAFFSNDSTASDYITTETNDSSQILLN